MFFFLLNKPQNIRPSSITITKESIERKALGETAFMQDSSIQFLFYRQSAHIYNENSAHTDTEVTLALQNSMGEGDNSL